MLFFYIRKKTRCTSSHLKAVQKLLGLEIVCAMFFVFVDKLWCIHSTSKVLGCKLKSNVFQLGRLYIFVMIKGDKKYL